MRAFTSAATKRPSTTSRQYKTLFIEVVDKNRELIWPTREADKVEVVFEYGPTRHCYKNKNWRVLVEGIEPSGQESSEMKAQTLGTNGASGNSVFGIAQARKGSTMLKTMIFIWIVLLLLALNLMAFVTRITEKHRANNPFVESSKNHTK